MKIEALSALLFLLIAANEAKIMERCELAKILKNEEMDKIPGCTLEDWVCMANHQSGFDTSAMGPPNKDGSHDFGIFQLNSRYWCTYEKLPSENMCNKPCTDFTDDNIKDDMECAKRIARDSQMNAWVAWVQHCKGKDLSEWTQDCKL